MVFRLWLSVLLSFAIATVPTYRAYAEDTETFDSEVDTAEGESAPTDEDYRKICDDPGAFDPEQGVFIAKEGKLTPDAPLPGYYQCMPRMPPFPDGRDPAGALESFAGDMGYELLQFKNPFGGCVEWRPHPCICVKASLMLILTLLSLGLAKIGKAVDIVAKIAPVAEKLQKINTVLQQIKNYTSVVEKVANNPAFQAMEGILAAMKSLPEQITSIDQIDDVMRKIQSITSAAQKAIEVANKAANIANEAVSRGVDDFDFVRSYRLPVNKVETVRVWAYPSRKNRKGYASIYIPPFVQSVARSVMDKAVAGDGVFAQLKAMDRMFWTFGKPTYNKDGLKALEELKKKTKGNIAQTSTGGTTDQVRGWAIMPEWLRYLKIPFLSDIHKIKPPMIDALYWPTNAFRQVDKVMSVFPNTQLMKQVAYLRANPTACSTFMPSIMGYAVKPPEGTCMPYNLGELVPFTYEVGPIKEGPAAAKATQRAFIASQFLWKHFFYDFSTKGKYPDKVQWIRGRYLRESLKLKCEDLVLETNRYGTGNIVENPARPGTAAHWKWFKGCPFKPDFVVPVLPDWDGTGNPCGNFVYGNENEGIKNLVDEVSMNELDQLVDENNDGIVDNPNITADDVKNRKERNVDAPIKPADKPSGSSNPGGVIRGDPS